MCQGRGRLRDFHCLEETKEKQHLNAIRDLELDPGVKDLSEKTVEIRINLLVVFLKKVVIVYCCCFAI